jgi:hypothetical protein
LGQIIWFLWLGIVLLRSNPSMVTLQNAFEQQPSGAKA